VDDPLVPEEPLLVSEEEPLVEEGLPVPEVLPLILLPPDAPLVFDSPGFEEPASLSVLLSEFVPVAFVEVFVERFVAPFVPAGFPFREGGM
jgi:hypothetical protein